MSPRRLMTVADLSTVWLTASVPQKDLRYLSKGQEITASLAAWPGEEFTGKVLFVGDLVDSDLRTAKVRIAFQIQMDDSSLACLRRLREFGRFRAQSEIGRD